jgi:diadenylate cyclase
VFFLCNNDENKPVFFGLITAFGSSCVSIESCGGCGCGILGNITGNCGTIGGCFSLGHTKSSYESSTSSRCFKQNSENEIDVVKEVIEVVKYLTKTKTGALIVFKKSLSAMAYSEVGTSIDAKVSAELILTIFHPNTPLHDGAMVIEGTKINSAGVLLPLTEDPKLSWKYGTRHRAALGMSEVSDAACLVVSEETGDVSICMDGMLKKYEDLTTLKSDLESILGVKPAEAQVEKHKNIFDILRGK